MYLTAAVPRVVSSAEFGRVALGSYPPRAPTDPDVRTLAHPVPRPTDSPSATVPETIRSSYGDMWFEPRCARHVSLNRVCRPTLRFPPQGPPRRVPLLQQYYQSATTSCRSSRCTSFPSLGGTSAFTRSVRSPADECTAGAWSWSPGISSRDFPRKRQDLPSSWEIPIVRLHMFPSDAGRTACTRPFTVQQRGPWYYKSKGSHERSFDAQ